MSQVIIISSILKPVSDVRSYLRLATSLANHPSLEVHISGTASQMKSEDNSIFFHSLGKYSRNLITRIRFHFRTLKIFKGLRPKVIIITTFELIPIAIFYKVLYSTKLVYDIQENYEYNILYQNIYPSFIKKILASTIRLLQHWSSRQFRLFLLAEKCYEKELNFGHKPYIILQNKVPPIYFPKANRNELGKKKFTFLFSGTLAEETGVNVAISWYQKLKPFFDCPELIIVGFAAELNYRNKLIRLARENADIVLITDTQPLAHAQIMDYIVKADVGIVSYPVTRANQDKVPTKVFEYSYYELPILTYDDSYWYRVGSDLGSAVSNQSIEQNPGICSESIKKTIETNIVRDFENSLWKEETDQLVNSILTIIK